MKPKTMILMLVAVGCGLTAAILVQQLKAKNDTPKQYVLAANFDMPAGYKVENLESCFTKKEYLRGTAPGDSFDAENLPEQQKEILNKKVVVNLKKDEVITKKHLEDITIGKNLLPGYRAMTVPVRIDTAGAGFILPNAKVDLITTYTNDNGRMIAKVFLQDVTVLAINAETQRPETGPTMLNPTTATLAVKTEDAGRVTLAKRLGGEIIMVLRGATDREIEKDRTKLTLLTLDGTGKQEDETEKYLIAKQDISAGTKVDKDMFEEKEFPVKVLDDTYIKGLNDVGGDKVFAFALKKGGPIPRSALVGTKDPGPTPPTPAPAPVHTLTIHNGTKEPIKATFTMSNGKAVGGSARETTPPPSGDGPKTGSEGK